MQQTDNSSMKPTPTTRGYVEAKDHVLRLALWRLMGWLMRLMPYNKMRTLWLRIFGAKMGPCCHVYPSVRIYAPWNLTLGEWTCIGPRVEIYDKGPVRIGSETVISQDVWICTASHDISAPHMDLVTRPVAVGDHVWIAARAAVLPGVAIGDGAVIGACSVVTKDVAAWKVAAGNPAVIRKDRVVR